MLEIFSKALLTLLPTISISNHLPRSLRPHTLEIRGPKPQKHMLFYKFQMRPFEFHYKNEPSLLDGRGVQGAQVWLSAFAVHLKQHC